MTAGRRTHYQVLGVEFDADSTVIRRAYRRRAREVHPDHHPPENKDRARRQFERLQKAYRILSDSRRRALYDRDLLRRGRTGYGVGKFWAHWRGELNDSSDRPVRRTRAEEQVMDSFEADWLEERYGGTSNHRERFRRHLNYGKLHLSQGNLDQAEGEFLTAHQFCHNNILCTYYIGMCYERRGNFEEAVNRYERAVRIGASRSQPYLNKCLELRSHLIRLLEDLGESDRAREHRLLRREIRQRTGLSDWMGEEPRPVESDSGSAWVWLRERVFGSR